MALFQNLIGIAIVIAFALLVISKMTGKSIGELIQVVIDLLGGSGEDKENG